MAPNTTTADETIQQFEKLNLKKLAREVGCSYQVFPKETVCIYLYSFSFCIFFF
jgi:sulfonate dioxygenase